MKQESKRTMRRLAALLCVAAMLVGTVPAVAAEPTAGRKIDVWDFTGQVEADTAVYTNHITPAAWVASTALVDGTLSNGSVVTFGDLSVTHNANDRIYSAYESADWAGILGGNAQNKYGNAYEDGYEAQGGWYCNGSGGESRRFLTLENVKAGDKIVAYMGSASGEIVFHFDLQSETAAQAETVSVAGKEFGKFEFIAQQDGAYKLWTDAAGKAMFHRIIRLPGVAVSGRVEFPSDFAVSGCTMKFVNQQTRQETPVALADDHSFTVSLAPGYTYNAALVGATGWGFTAETRTLITADADAVTGKSALTLVVEPKSTYAYTGAVAGFAPGYDLSKLALTMIPEAGTGSQPVALTIDQGTLRFQGVLDPSVRYTVDMAGANDYLVKTPAEVASEGVPYSEDIVVEPKPTQAVSGKLLGLEGAAVTALRFENVEDGDTYPAALTSDGYTVNLRQGSYLAVATAEGYTTQTHVAVADKPVEKDLLFVSTAPKPAVAWSGDIYVGYSDKSPNFATVREAVDAVSRMGVDSEAKRVTVHIAPGTYREQIILDTPYVSFVNDQPAQEVLLTWYYGIGYQYYSAGPDGDGYYDAQRAFDKYEKHIADRWGTAVRVKPGAVGFRAEGITFENSFNRYVTDEELADGVEPTGETLKLERNYAADVNSKAATERAAALCVEADGAEFYRCQFLSSQDTLYTAGDAYFKNCLIEGQTDYIFGSGNVIFDGCELRWKGYSDGETGGYITAQRSEPDEKGYLFRSCTVTANPNLTVAPGCFGRPWGKDAAVAFVHTRLETASLIAPEGWTDMSGNQPEDARFGEWGTVALGGGAVDTAQRKAAPLTAQPSVTDYLGGWTPDYYVAAAEEVDFATAPILTDNGDINLPKAGHTLTVGYSLGEANSANDVSVIEWYRVSPDGANTLVKTSVANVSKTYQIQPGDLGCRIMVNVIPSVVGGQILGDRHQSYTLVESVKEGYDDPAAAAVDMALGEGINLFLAGDSTVKDYTAAGMYNSGKNQDEGSWGEWLQSFFDPDQVTVVNYAQGGRSARNFINEGSLAKIAERIGPGDYLFIQFGHNDASNADQSHLLERHAPLGAPDANGIYPSTPGVLQPTSEELSGQGWGETCYTWDCGGTYKWYLQQYIDVARAAGATPVLVTPVSRMYYEPDGSIRPHHDEATSEVKNNAYCAAVRQLAAEQNVLCIDAFALTEKMFVDAYAACGSDIYGQQVMCVGESTHSNKLGGVIEAALMAGAIQDLGVNISAAVKAPAKVLGQTPEGETAFLVNGEGTFAAYDMLQDYAEAAPYWQTVGQRLFDAIGQKAQALASQRFADVPVGHWAEEAVNAMAQADILKGVDAKNRLFGLTAPVTRASVATILWRLKGESVFTPPAGAEVPSRDYYADVAEGTWYTEAVRWATEQGLVQGRGDGAFGPDDSITREQLALMLWRFSEGADQSASAASPAFAAASDSAGVSPWAVGGMAWAVEKGVIQGNETGALNPQGQVTRAEAAVMLYRLTALAK